MMNHTSAYERIMAGVAVEGKLPYTFSLEEKRFPNKLNFMPGAMDGIDVFHTGWDNEKESIQQIASLLKKYFRTGKVRYIADVEAVLGGGRTISMIDLILQSLREDHMGVDPDKIVDLSLDFIKTSSNIELIKIGIGLLGLFDLGNTDKGTEVIATLALYDDFTLYAVVAASNWTNGNRIIFQIAKNVDGWGKIHAVERLEPETEEISEWILRSGCANGIMDAYLGLICATKGDLISTLRQDTVDPEMFDSIAIIVDAMLDEGPASGISEYKHAEEALMLFVNHAKQHAKNVEHLWRLVNLQDWAVNATADYADEISPGCTEIINRTDWQEKIMSAVKRHDDDFEFFCASNVASRLGIDIAAELFDIVKAEPLKYYSHMSQLMKNTPMVDDIISLYETVLPLSEMADGMGDYLFADKLIHEHHCLGFVLQGLGAYPLQGVKLVQTGLNCRVISNRNTSCRVLLGWVKAQKTPLSDISPELHREIERIYQIEVNEHTKETMRKLLAGGVEDE